MRKPILVSILIFVFLSIFPITGLAQTVDQVPVIDDAGIFGNQLGDVQAAANQLISRGADVRVRTIQTFGAAGNLDRYEEQLELQSPSWLAPNGDRKNNLIVLLISMQESKYGLYYGSVWNNILDNNWLRIQTDVMNPYFSSGDYAGGTIAGLEELQRLIESGGQPTTPTSTPGKGFSPVLVTILVIVIAVIVLLFFRNHRSNRAKRQAVRQKAMLAKQGAASGINELNETIQMLEIKVDVVAGKVVPDDAVALKDGLEKVKGLIGQSSQAYSEMSHSAGDPENPKLGEAELAAIETEYQKILSNLREAREEIKKVEDNVASVQQSINDFPARVDEVNTAIVEAQQKEVGIREVGFKSKYPAELITKGQATLKLAQELAFKKRSSEAIKTAGLALDQIKQAIQVAEELPQKKQESEMAISVLASRIEQVKGVINNGGDVFDRLVQEYADSNWESIRGNGTEAENRINWALDALDDARTATAPEQQEWHHALELIVKANIWLGEAESLMKSISELEKNLIAERTATPGEIEAARIDIVRAWDYINRYDEDIRESLEDDLRAAEGKNEAARQELILVKPDYFKAGKLAREAHESADKILIQARAEHEAAERLRAKATTAYREASSKVSIAAKYVENHHPVVRGEARSYLNTAVEALRQAESSTDTNSQITLAERAESAADQAYTLAQKDVNNTTMSIPNISIPTIIFPTSGSTGGGWGLPRRTSSTSSSSTPRRTGGGGSSGWSSRSSGTSRGGGVSRGGGGSSGW